MAALRVCTFKGLQNLPLYVAQSEGFFAARDLQVTLTYTTGSAAQLAGLARGEYDLVQTAPDNVIHLDTNPAAFGLDPQRAPRITMLMGGSTGPLGLYAQPGIVAPDRLRGASLGVDNPSSGFALVMYDMLARHGLLRDRDYTVRVCGGTSARLNALQDRAVAATMLYAPYDAIAAASGYPRLATSTDHYPAYASLATAGIAGWVAAHFDELTRYIAAVLAALRWIYDPNHAEAIVQTLRREQALGLDTRVAALAYAAFVDPSNGFGLDARLSERAIQQVIDLRAAYADGPRAAGAPEQYYDLRCYRQAQTGRR